METKPRVTATIAQIPPKAVREEIQGDEASNVGEVSRKVKISSQVNVHTVDELPSRRSQRVPSARMRSTP